MLIKAFVILLGLFFFSPNGLFAHEAEGISYPTLRIISRTLTSQIADNKSEKIAIFKDDVRLELRDGAEFFSDQLLIGFTQEKQIKYFEMAGNVTMQKGDLRISSETAYTANLHNHIDFKGMVAISTNEVDINSMNIRYDFLTNTFFAF